MSPLSLSRSPANDGDEGLVGFLEKILHVRLVNLSGIYGTCPTWPKARENAERQIQINYYKNQTFIKSHMQDSKLMLVVNPISCYESNLLFKLIELTLGELQTVLQVLDLSGQVVHYFIS